MATTCTVKPPKKSCLMCISHTLNKYRITVDLHSKRKQYKNCAVQKHQSLVLNALIINSYVLKKNEVAKPAPKLES